MHLRFLMRSTDSVVFDGQVRLKKGESINDYAWLQRGEGIKLGIKSGYVICERSLMVLLTGWKFMNQSLISQYFNVNINAKKYYNERDRKQLFKNYF